MTTNSSTLVSKDLGFQPNANQVDVMNRLEQFIDFSNHNDVFILSGPAGSGKTSLVKALVDFCSENEIRFSLSAPTGRASQILSSKTGIPASTLHSSLFTTEMDENTMQIKFIPKTIFSRQSPMIYIVDEASMISDNSHSDGAYLNEVSLLGQLIHAVKTSHPQNKLILIGDKYQLPPVGSMDSPALTTSYLDSKYHLKPDFNQLHIVERQAKGSYILENAGKILDAINNRTTIVDLKYVAERSFSGAIYHYINFFDLENLNNCIMIANANSQVNALNTWVRNFKFNYTKRIIMPDEVMVCNQNIELDNNMLYKGNSFIVRNTWKPEEFAGLNFINALIEFISPEGNKVEARTKIILESVTNTDGFLSLDQEKSINHEAFKKNRKFRESRRQTDDAFVNAVRARYGYALTCHKAQGGEWKNVFLHPGYRKDNLRWLYTAITRASENLYSWAA